jgi:protein-S-isoprenylcysteine O-methyltransferase Ste14
MSVGVVDQAKSLEVCVGIQLSPLAGITIACGLVLIACSVFARVRADYRAQGALSRPVAVLQTGFFFLYALSSYLFLDSRITHVTTRGLLLGLAVILMIAGLSTVLLSMPFLGTRSFGREVGRLHTEGIYRYSRNPQLVGGFSFIAGYALLWPSWIGLLWAGLWLPISGLMVRAEEDHLLRVFGKEYEEYRRRTPRFVGMPRQR